MISLRQLKYFDAVVRSGHFGRAANQCAVTQPALSMQIQELEKELGVQLLERGRSGIILTAAGREIAGRAARVLTDIRDIVDVARRRDRPFRWSRISVWPDGCTCTGELGMTRSKTNAPLPIGRRSFLQGTGLATLGLPHLFAGGQSLQAAAPGSEQESHLFPVAARAPQSSTAPQAATVPTRPLVPWMYMIYPLEQWLSDYKRTFDAWADG